MKDLGFNEKGELPIGRQAGNDEEKRMVEETKEETIIYKKEPKKPKQNKSKINDSSLDTINDEIELEI